MIQAVILAGGLGTRMRPFTETIPKPMLAVLGKPFLEHQLVLLRDNGIERILLLVGYLGEQVEAYFGDGNEYGVALSYSYESSPMGTGGALLHANAKLESEFLLVNGDTLLEIEYAALVGKFRVSEKSAAITASPKRGGGAGNLLLGQDGAILDYSKRHPRGRHVDAGVVALHKRVLDLLPTTDKPSLEEEVFPQLIARGDVSAFETDITFFDMGTPAGLAALEEHLRMKAVRA